MTGIVLKIASSLCAIQGLSCPFSALYLESILVQEALVSCDWTRILRLSILCVLGMFSTIVLIIVLRVFQWSELQYMQVCLSECMCKIDCERMLIFPVHIQDYRNIFCITYVSLCFTLGIFQKCSVVLSHIIYTHDSLRITIKILHHQCG